MIGLVFDTESTGMVDFSAPSTDWNQPWPVEIAWQIVDLKDFSVYQEFVSLIELPPEAVFDPDAVAVHGIDYSMWSRFGEDPKIVASLFESAVYRSDWIIGHSVDFDRRIMESFFFRLGLRSEDLDLKWLKERPRICTMKASTSLCKIEKANGRRGYKWPKLTEAFEFFTGEDMGESHSAMADVRATTVVLKHLIEAGAVDLDSGR